jgi:hypothetical protein
MDVLLISWYPFQSVVEVHVDLAADGVGSCNDEDYNLIKDYNLFGFDRKD